jgi:hypothetical protein
MVYARGEHAAGWAPEFRVKAALSSGSWPRAAVEVLIN